MALTGASASAGQPLSSLSASTTTVALHQFSTVDLSQLATSPAAPVRGGHTSLGSPAGLLPWHAGSSSLHGNGPHAQGLSPFASRGGLGAGFDGITAAVNASTNPAIGTVSPPDQGLAVGPSSSGTVLAEFVNQTLNFYSPGGQTLKGPIPAYEVFGLSPSAFLSDPRAYWDPATGHWFLTMFTFAISGTPPSPGECAANPGSPDCSTQFIAVSDTTDPLGKYTVFSFDTTDMANSANGCPCYGDYDMIGADANGFYITTNEFPEFAGGPGFNGTVMYAMSKSGLISAAEGSGSAPTVQRYTVPFVGPGADPFAGYHLSPSTVTQGSAAPNTEYFVESNANLPVNATAHGLEVFALLNTGVLASGGSPQLVKTTVDTENYSEQPPNAVQKSGPTPYGTSQGYTYTPQLQTDFNAVQEVTYASGRLYAELSTGITSGNETNAGAAWFVLQPTPGASSVSATNVANGYVATSQNILYPVIGVDAQGHGAMAFAVSGPDMYPSAAYVNFNGAKGPTGAVHIAAAGTNPLDDFTCYPPFSTGQCRYGDYSMAQAYNGRIYMATEYVGSQPRDQYSNWDTRLYWSH